MRHLVARRKLNRTSAHRTAMLRNMAQSLFEHEQVRTTLPKAKELRRFAEKLITLARKAHGGDLAAVRLLTKKLSDRAIISADHREAYEYMNDASRHKVLRARSGRRHRTGEPKAGLAFTAESVIHRLITVVAPRFMDRPGGYTRIIHLERTRIGDNGEQAIVQLVGSEEGKGEARVSTDTARKKRAVRRYDLAKSLVKGGKPRAEAKPEVAEVEQASDEAAAEESSDS